MKVLFIPSWLPYRDDPLAGKFFLDQALAIADAEVAEIFLLNWGQNEFQLAVRRPLSSLKKLARLIPKRRGLSQIAPRLTEIRVPHLSWTSFVVKGNIDSLIPKIKLPEKPDLIHAQVTFPAGYVAMRLAEKHGLPYIITEHSGPFPFPEFLKRGAISPLITEPLKAAERIVAVSSHLKQEIRTKTGLEALVIPNPVNTDFFIPSANPRPEGPLRLFTLSTISTSKGSADLLQALKLLSLKTKDWHLFWGGAGPLLNWARQKAEDEGLRDHIIWLGRLSPTQSLEQYQLCDFYVMPSRFESFSLVIAEALACGKPVVATNCGGPRDLVNDLCGILVPKQNPAALAEALLKMGANFSSYSPQAIREHCVQNFGHKAVTARIGELYQSVFNAKGTP
ncbi:MAG TPA: glycosyltransferase [Candidatus Syntrophosphaera sp.]|nr:glycosyltransferase [Candidatus Syntrophosphaera sp.]HPW38795.1 glycosyltransferase [Candidatus Syntrophosphaera sp.]HPX67380.1 glycosyltransferase [Candidatus Syntrophosphaera sp.]HQC47506.1 glycosyltransferase [Candidatus Syntrophosphaera sp.]